MAGNRDDEFDFSKFDDFGDNDIKVPGKVYNTKSDRSVAKASKFLTSGLKSTMGEIGPSLNREVSRKFSQSKGVVNEAFGVMSEIERMRVELMKDMAPVANQTKRVAQRLLRQAKPYMPNSLHDKLEKKFEVADDKVEKANVDQAQDAAINVAIERVFAEQQLIEEERRKEEDKKAIVEKQIDRTLDASRHREILRMMDDMRRPIIGMGGFFKTVYPAYLKESLKLQFKSFFVMQKQLETSQVMAKMLENKLEEIRQNTALPDIQKKTFAEGVKEEARRAISQRVQNKIGNWASNITKNVREKVFGSVRGGMDAFSQALGMGEMYLDMQESMGDMGGGSGGLAGLLGQGAGKALGRFGAGKAIKGGLEKYAPYISSMDQLGKTIKMRAALKSRDKAKENKGGIAGFLWSLLDPGIRDNAGKVENKLAKSPNEPVSFDVATRASIVEIIPGFLARIEQNTRSISEGGPVDELVFDQKSRDFVSVSKFRETMFNDMFGSKEARAKHAAQGVATLRAASSNHKGDIVKFDRYNAEITKFIANHSVELMDPDPLAVRDVARTGIVESGYKQKAFQGIKHPAEVAQILCTAFFVGDEVDKGAVERFRSYLTVSMTGDEYLDKFPEMAEAFGHGRHFKDLFRPGTTQEGTKIFDTSAIAKARFGGLDRDTYKTTLDSETKFHRDQINAANKAKDDIQEPAWVKKLGLKDALDTITGSRMVGDDGDIASFQGALYSGLHNPTANTVLSRHKRKKGRGAKSQEATIVPVEIMNQPIRVILENVQKSDQKTTSEQKEECCPTEAIRQFEETFKAYAERQQAVATAITQYLPNLSDISSNIINLNLGQSLQAGAEQAKSMAGRLVTGGKSLIGKTFTSGKDFIKWSWDKQVEMLKIAKDGALGLGGLGINALANVGLPALGMAGRGLANVMSTQVKAIGMMGRGAGKVIGGIWNALTGGDKAILAPFVDIYLKDQVDPNKPLLTKKKQEEGVVFSDGKPVTSSHDIDRVVMDPKTQEILISEEDIKHGLVTAHGIELKNAKAAAMELIKNAGTSTGKLGSGIKKLFKGAGGAIKGIGGLLGGIHGKMFDMGLGAAKNIGNLGVKMISKLFGLDNDSPKNMEKVLKKEVGDKLDKIYDLLLKTIGKDYNADDKDGDGLADNSWQEKDKKKKEGAQSSLIESLTGGLGGKKRGGGLWGLLGGALFGGSRKSRGGEDVDIPGMDDDDDGGMGISDFLEYKLMDTVADKFSKSKVVQKARKFGKFVKSGIGGAGRGLMGLLKGGGGILLKLGKMLGQGALVAMGKGLPGLLSAAGGLLAKGGGLVKGAMGLGGSALKAATGLGSKILSFLSIGDKAASAASIASASGAATTAAAAGTKAASGGSKIMGIITKLISYLPTKFQKVLKPPLIAKAIAKGGASVMSKIISKFTPIGWVITGGSMAYAALQGYNKAAEILGLPEDKLSVADKLVVGASAAMCDGLLLEELGLLTTKTLAEVLGAGSDAKKEVEKEQKEQEKPVSDIKPKADSEEVQKTKDQAEQELKQMETAKAQNEAKGNLIQKTMDKVLNSTVLLAPLKWLSYPILHPETSARWIYNWFGTEDWNEAAQECRAKIYGIDPKQSYGFFSNGKSVMLKIEKKTAEIIQEGITFSEKDIEKMAGWFNLDDSTEAIRYWTTWFYQRFMPAFKIFLDILKAYGCTYADHDYKFPRDKGEELIKKFENATKDKSAELKALVPTEKGYKEFQKTIAKVYEEEASGNKNAVSKHAIDDAIDQKKKNQDTIDRGNKYHSGGATQEAVRRMNDIEGDRSGITDDQRYDQRGGETTSNMSKAVSTSDASTMPDKNGSLKSGSPVASASNGSGGLYQDMPTNQGNGWDGVKGVITSAAKMVGVDPGLLATMASIESGFNANAKAKTSSASGLFQFINSTWNNMLSKYGAKYGIPAGTSQLDARANALMGAEYLKENQKYLESKLGRKATDTDLYTAHFLGAGGAVSLLKGNPDDIAANLNPKAAAANKSIFYDKGRPRTLREVYEVLDNKVKGHRSKWAAKARTEAGQAATSSQDEQSTGPGELPPSAQNSTATTTPAVTPKESADVTPSPNAVSPSSMGPNQVSPTSSASPSSEGYGGSTASSSSTSGGGGGATPGSAESGGGEGESGGPVGQAPKSAEEAIAKLKELGVRALNTTGGGGYKGVMKVNPDLLSRFTLAAEDFMKSSGEKISITSAWRSTADQQSLQGTKGAGKVGSSPHQRGLALDIGNEAGGGVKGRGYGTGTIADRFEKVASKYGLWRPYSPSARASVGKQPLSNEEQHFEVKKGASPLNTPEAAGLDGGSGPSAEAPADATTEAKGAAVESGAPPSGADVTSVGAPDPAGDPTQPSLTPSADAGGGTTAPVSYTNDTLKPAASTATTPPAGTTAAASDPAWATSMLTKLDDLIKAVQGGLKDGKIFEEIRDAIGNVAMGDKYNGYQGPATAGAAGASPATSVAQATVTAPPTTAPVASMARTTTAT